MIALPTVLVIDDEPSIHEMYDLYLSPHQTESQPGECVNNFRVLHAYGASEAVFIAESQALKGTPIHVALVDLKMMPIDGLATVRQLHQIDPRTHFVIVTGFAEQAEKRVKEEASDIPMQIVSKPFEGREIYDLATNLCDRWKLRHPNELF